MKALVLHGPGDLRYEDAPKPAVQPASVVVKVLAAPVWDYISEVIKGERSYPLPFPLIFGTCCVARVEEAGPDVATLQPGQLVFCDYIVRSKDDPALRVVLGYHGGLTPQEQNLSANYWRNGCFAEYALFPAENVHAVDEDLIAKHSITPVQLTEIASVMPALGAANAIGISPGETVLVLPSTGFFSSSAVSVALALGANVIAGSRSQQSLDRLVEHLGEDGKRVAKVVLTGDFEKDMLALRAATPGGEGADAYIDYCPPKAAGTTHIQAGLLALKRHGRCCFAGVIMDNVALPYAVIMGNCLTIKGQFAQSRSDVVQALRLIHSGQLRLNKVVQGPTKLKEHEKVLQLAVENRGWRDIVVFEP